MSRLEILAEAASREGLVVAGTAVVLPGDGLGPKIRSVALLAPDEPAFWPRFAASAEAMDGLPDPLDRWSRRVVGRLACGFGAKAVFPSGGPPWRPFIAWALRSGRSWNSPVGLLVHDVAGLWISFRGAVALEEEAPPASSRRPCEDCVQKLCLTACPVEALTSRGYDVAACHAFLDTAPGQDCLVGGCRVRRACPVGTDRRNPAQSAFHMKAFHPT